MQSFLNTQGEVYAHPQFPPKELSTTGSCVTLKESASAYLERATTDPFEIKCSSKEDFDRDVQQVKSRLLALGAKQV